MLKCTSGASGEMSVPSVSRVIAGGLKLSVVRGQVSEDRVSEAAIVIPDHKLVHLRTGVSTIRESVCHKARQVLDLATTGSIHAAVELILESASGCVLVVAPRHCFQAPRLEC